MAKDILSKMTARIEEVEKKYTEDLDKIDRLLSKAMEKLDEADAEIQAAIEAEDKALYAAAKKRKAAAQDDVDLYAGKKRVIMSRRKISDEESTRLLNEIYEDSATRGKQYQERCSEILTELLALHKTFTDSVRKNDQMIAKWNSKFEADQETPAKQSYNFQNDFYITLNSLCRNIAMRGTCGALKGAIAVPPKF